MSEVDQLHELDWVLIPNTSYIMKYVFHDTGYNVLVSNLTSLYSEKMAETDIHIRFCKINEYAQMKPRIILENLKKSLEKCFNDKSDLVMKLDEKKLVITLNFQVAHALCNYDIEMNLLPSDQVVHYIIGPTVLGALLSQKKVLELQKILSVEGSKTSVSGKSTVTSQNVVEPEWLKGKNIPAETVLDSFLKLQSHFKDLYAENYVAYSSKKIKSENISPIRSVVPHKRGKLQESTNSEQSINFEDDDGCISIKKEEETNANASLSQPPRLTVKKKKIIKF